MKKAVLATWLVAAAISVTCNNGVSSMGDSREEKKERNDRSRRIVIDNAEYVDFTAGKHDARTVRVEDMLFVLGGNTYKNGNSSIVINRQEGTVELSSDIGVYNGKQNCQIYGVFGFDILAASEDCLYIRKAPRKKGYMLIDGNIYRDDAVPDLGVCLPLYGYSKNRIEVSPVMDGHIIMPSGTYWKK